MTPEEDRPGERLERILRSQLAAASLPALPQAANEALLAWLARGARTEALDASWWTAVAADLSLLAWWRWLPGTTEPGRPLPGATRGGEWIVATGERSVEGWSVAGALPLGRLTHDLPELSDLLRGWARDAAVEAVAAGRALEGGDAWVSVELPGAGAVARVEAGLRALDAIGLRTPPDEALSALLNAAGTHTLRIEATAAGPGAALIGSRLPEPRWLQLAQASGADPAALGAFLGVLGLQPTRGEWRQTADGDGGALLHLRVH